MEEDVLTTPAGSAPLGKRVFAEPGQVLPERLRSAGFATTAAPPPSSGWHLGLDQDGLVLRNREGAARFRPDAPPAARGRGPMAIARACGARPGLTVLDAMAGWGADGLVLAAAGCTVTMTESHPIVFAMLVDLAERCAPHVRVELEDARRLIPAGFDVVYLDPMFEPRRKTALPGKPMQVLRDIVGRDAPDLAETLALARRHARERVVVKRHTHARAVGAPDWRIPGRTVRFDVYRPLT